MTVIQVNDIANYYSKKLIEKGETPLGADWNGLESQILRFEQLCKIIRDKESFSLNDLGCGYGALIDYLSNYHSQFSYYGFDISDEMINACQRRFKEMTQARFLLASCPDEIADYSVASGIFNVRLNHSDEEWNNHLIATLDNLNHYSRIGFSFNCLTSYSDTDKMQDYLYYPNPGEIFDLCKKRYSRHVALLHDYGLYEFTILVKKELG